MADPPLAVIVGPTAVGKSDLAMALCERFDGEIVSADSRQIYRELDIGTAKPTLEDRTRVAHHLVDIACPGTRLSVAEYQDLAYEAIGAVHVRHRLPFLVGGTGQYVRAVVEGWLMPRVPPQTDLRRQLRREAEVHGPEALHERLARVDPEAAARINARNVRRIVRALEVYQATGQPITDLQDKRPPPFSILVLGLTMDRAALYERADRRICAMIEQGWVEEVRQLVDRGYGPQLSAMSGIGYGELVKYLRGEICLSEAIRRIKSSTRRFIRHQYSWFRLDDPRIHWVEQGPQAVQQTAAIIGGWLRAN